jgi:hypothetical protein
MRRLAALFILASIVQLFASEKQLEAKPTLGSLGFAIAVWTIPECIAGFRSSRRQLPFVAGGGLDHRTCACGVPGVLHGDECSRKTSREEKCGF